MPALLIVFADPVKVAMLLICIFGAAFMIWFLVKLLTEQTRMRARYIVRFKLGESRSRLAFADQSSDESSIMPGPAIGEPIAAAVFPFRCGSSSGFSAEEMNMRDVIFVAASVAFFLIAIAYVRFCDRIR